MENRENCSICGLNYKKVFKSDHLKSVKHLEKLKQYYCKKCNLYMPILDKSSHLNSDEHKNKTEQRRVWCEDCNRYISDKTRHFQSEIHLQNRQQNSIIDFGTALLPSGNGVEVIVNENTYIKLKINPDENLEHKINELLSKSYFPRYKYQISYLAKFSKIVNGEEEIFKRWIKSDLIYNTSIINNLHNTLMQKLDDEQLEGSGFQFQEIEEVILQVYKIRDIQASSYIELPGKYKDSKSIINIKNNDQYCFLWCILAYLYPVEDHKDRISKYLMHVNKLNLKGLEFPMKVKDISRFENLNRLCINVFELTGNVLTPIQINTNYDQPQIDLLLFENHYCLITKLHCLINQDSHMKHVCRRCLTAFRSEPVLLDHIDRCQKQQPTKITFSWKDQLKFEDYHMKVPVPIRVYADFECINQPQKDPKVLFKQIPIAVGYYVISPFGNKYNVPKF